jgi:hypothetical protein
VLAASLLVALVAVLLLLLPPARTGDEGMGAAALVLVAAVVGVGVGASVVGRALVSWGGAVLRRRRSARQLGAAIGRLQANRRTLHSFLGRLADEKALVKLQLEDLYNHPLAVAVSTSSGTAQERAGTMKRLSTKLARLSALREQKQAALRDIDHQVHVPLSLTPPPPCCMVGGGGGGWWWWWWWPCRGLMSLLLHSTFLSLPAGAPAVAP